jgi:flavin reductase (DIM6/NTAB) family NADH-FMN oxidoreductase RutF
VMISIDLSVAHRVLAPRLVLLVGTQSPTGTGNCIPVSNVTSVSTSPEAVAVAVYHQWQTAQNLLAAPGFTLSLPSAGQLRLLWQLGAKYSGYADVATRPKMEEFREKLNWDFSSYGPVLTGAIAWLECVIERRITDIGDHCLVIGVVTRVMADPEVCDPLGSPPRIPEPVMQWSRNHFASPGPQLDIDFY